MICLSSLVEKAIKNKEPVVALESTIITHGMPYPQNVQTALEVEAQVRQNGALPATIGVIHGKVIVGLSREEIDFLGKLTEPVVKAAAKDLSYVVAMRKNAGTTVSATMKIAHAAGIKVFATGGIGGVHREVETSFDISSDLTEFAATPVIVVSAGCKSILDIPKTLEYLETLGVQILGYNTSYFPAFYSQSSGIKLQFNTEDVKDIVNMFNYDRELKRPHGLLVANPIPLEDEIPHDEVNTWVQLGLSQLREQKISGKEVTPFLLATLNNLSKGRSLKANISLIKNNAKVAALVAKAFV